MMTCPTCDGLGLDERGDLCPDCGGWGEVWLWIVDEADELEEEIPVSAEEPIQNSEFIILN